MVEVFTIGGGEYIVNTFNAVAAWTGGGGYRSLLQVVMVLGLIYSLLAVAFTMNVRVWLNWFLGSSLIYMCLMVPTVTVKVTDRINPSLAPAVVDNVPLGLGVIASFTSQVGDWLTRMAETVFTMPSQLSYSSNGRSMVPVCSMRRAIFRSATPSSRPTFRRISKTASSATSCSVRSR